MGVLSIREFNANVSKALSRVEAGEVLEISKNGVIIAELRPKQRMRRSDPEWLRAGEALRKLMANPIAFGGPASYEERTE